LNRKFTTRAIAFVDNKIDYMLQQSQIIKAVGDQLDIEDPLCIKYASTGFQSIGGMLISAIVTINRTELLQMYQSSNSHCIMMTTTKLRSSI